MDKELNNKTREELLEEVKKLRMAIREHRDQSLHGLYWHHPAMWSLLPEKVDPKIEVPEWPQFLRGCVKYRESLDLQRPEAPRSKVES